MRRGAVKFCLGKEFGSVLADVMLPRRESELTLCHENLVNVSPWMIIVRPVRSHLRGMQGYHACWIPHMLAQLGLAETKKRWKTFVNGTIPIGDCQNGSAA